MRWPEIYACGGNVGCIKFPESFWYFWDDCQKYELLFQFYPIYPAFFGYFSVFIRMDQQVFPIRWLGVVKYKHHIALSLQAIVAPDSVWQGAFTSLYRLNFAGGTIGNKHTSLIGLPTFACFCTVFFVDIRNRGYVSPLQIQYTPLTLPALGPKSVEEVFLLLKGSQHFCIAYFLICTDRSQGSNVIIQFFF